MKNKLSIVIPCYNAEKYISKCLDSLLVAADKVGRKNCEIIVVNDGSTDSSLDILQQYQNDITILTTVNQGVSAARNYGIANIQGGGSTFGLLMRMMKWMSIAFCIFMNHCARIPQIVFSLDMNMSGEKNGRK